MKYSEQESTVLEFKSNIPKNDQIIKTIIAFCNGTGGKLILGIEDDGTVCGIKEHDALELQEQLGQAIYQATSPPILPNIFLQRLGEKLILVIKASSGMNKPYFQSVKGIDAGTYVRSGRSTLKASAEIIQELQWQSRGIAFDAMPVYQASINDFEQRKIDNFFATRRHSPLKKVTNDVLQSYKFIINEHEKTYPTTAGILLFGREPQYYFSEAMIICSHFKGVSGREAIASIDCIGTLFEQFEMAYNFIVNRLSVAFTIHSLRREERLEIPPIALREILLNALVHRDYHHRGPSKIAIYDDRIEVFSPGNFPQPLPSLRLGLTTVRNTTICRAFREANYIEKLGTGFLTLFDSYDKWQLPEPNVQSGSGFVKCILPRPYRQNYRAPLFNDEQRILQLFEASVELSAAEIIQLTQIPRSSLARKLKALVDKKVLEVIGQGKATRYRRN